MYLDELIGMSRLKELARDQIALARVSGSPLAHTLVSGRGGLGKTRLAEAMAMETGQHLFALKPAEITTPHLLAGLMDVATIGAQKSGKLLFLFLDEVHQLSGLVQESCYDLMTDYEIEVRRGLGKKKYPPFTLFAATTDLDQLDSNSFVSRFRNHWTLEPYGDKEIAHIALLRCNKVPKMSVTVEALKCLAKASHGIPRTVEMLVDCVKAHVVNNGCKTVNSAIILDVLKKLEIDSNGLSKIHQQYIVVLREYARDVGTPCPLNWFVAKLHSNAGTIQLIEQELIRKGLITKTARGRVLTEEGKRYQS